MGTEHRCFESEHYSYYVRVTSASLIIQQRFHATLCQRFGLSQGITEYFAMMDFGQPVAGMFIRLAKVQMLGESGAIFGPNPDELLGEENFLGYSQEVRELTSQTIKEYALSFSSGDSPDWSLMNYVAEAFSAIIEHYGLKKDFPSGRQCSLETIKQLPMPAR